MQIIIINENHIILDLKDRGEKAKGEKKEEEHDDDKSRARFFRCPKKCDLLLPWVEQKKERTSGSCS